MSDEEIRAALTGFPELWKRVNRKLLPEGVVLMPGMEGRTSPYFL